MHNAPTSQFGVAVPPMSLLCCQSPILLACLLRERNSALIVSGYGINVTGGSRLPSWGQASPPTPFPSFTLPFPSPLALPPVRSSPLNTARGSGERCKFPHRGLGRSPSGNRIWCILALKSDIWYHQFY